jgi:membrane dipeptidase
VNRREFNRSAVVLALAAVAPAASRAQPAAPRYADMHSHLGIYSAVSGLNEAMSRAGMLVAARPIVADSPVIRRMPRAGYQVSRQPEAGELLLRFNERLERIRAEHSREKLIEIDSAARLRTTMEQGAPSVVISAEGADFLESDLQRLDAARQSGLRHLQLVHYRV